MLPDVPPGRYTLHVWEETLGTATNVSDSGIAAVTVQMSPK